MTTEIIQKIAIWYIPIYLILLLIPSIILFSKEFKYFTYFIFDKLCLDWNKRVEKPRIFFAGIGYLLVYCSWFTSKLKLGDIWFCTPLAILFSIAGLFTLYFVLSKTFEKKFLKYIRRKLNISISPAIINPDTHNIENIFNSLNQNSLKSDANTFYNLISLDSIADNEKIEWTGAVVQLIRFVFVLFNVKTDADRSLTHSSVRTIIEHYFKKNGEGIRLTDTGSEISNVKKEVDTNKEIFVDYKKEILSLIEESQK